MPCILDLDILLGYPTLQTALTGRDIENPTTLSVLEPMTASSTDRKWMTSRDVIMSKRRFQSGIPSDEQSCLTPSSGEFCPGIWLYFGEGEEDM